MEILCIPHEKENIFEWVIDHNIHIQGCIVYHWEVVNHMGMITFSGQINDKENLLFAKMDHFQYIWNNQSFYLEENDDSKNE